MVPPNVREYGAPAYRLKVSLRNPISLSRLVKAAPMPYYRLAPHSPGRSSTGTRMSLNSKLVGWLIVFGAIIIVVLGVGDYIQSTAALRFTLETRASALAMQAATDIERRWERAEAELFVVGYAASAGAASSLPRLLGRYEDVRVVRAGDAVVFEADVLGADPVVAAGCAMGALAIAVPFEDVGGVLHRVEARIPASDFFAGVPSVTSQLGKRGRTAVLRRADGARLYGAECDTDSAVEAAAVRHVRHAAATQDEGTGVGMLQLRAAGMDGDVTMAAARAPGSGLLVVAGADYAEFAAPFIELRRQYFGVIASVLGAAFLFMFLAIRRDMRRLEAIAGAADAIGHGRFDIWLPPPTGDEIGRVSLALGRMTDRLSSTLRQMEVSRSMAAVGELSTYLSHEIRNPLSSIRLNLQMLRRDLGTGSVPDDGEQLVGLCLSELQRLEDVVRTVLEVGRTGRQARGECDAHVVVRETLRVMRRKFEERGITVEERLHAGDDRVTMSSSAFRGVVMNLVLNAMDAVDGHERPQVRLETALLTEDDGGRQWLELRVSDNGLGVPPHLQERIFDPFFTTKVSGNGIGLPTALHAVRECGGLLRHEPAAWGSGAEFVVELPLVATGVTAGAELAAAGAK
jgi:signal transduction histidine kinase